MLDEIDHNLSVQSTSNNNTDKQTEVPMELGSEDESEGVVQLADIPSTSGTQSRVNNGPTEGAPPKRARSHCFVSTLPRFPLPHLES